MIIFHVFELILLSFFCLLICLSKNQLVSSKGKRERKFQERFNKVCSKYAFVQTYEEIMETTPDRYIVFVLHDKSQSMTGMGDRLAGLISAMAYALRFKRILLLQGDEAFTEMFKPYYFANKSDSKYNWGSWDWSGLKQDHFDKKNKDEDLYCVGPLSIRCALDHDFPLARVVRYNGNRCFLCRWITKRSLNISEEVQRSLHITEESDLYEVGGCMLRLALYPTAKLWRSLDEAHQISPAHMLYHYLKQKQTFHLLHPLHNRHPGYVHQQYELLSSPWLKVSNRSWSMSLSDVDYQVGVHFRCGDTSFKRIERTPSPNCTHLTNSTFGGTYSYFFYYSQDSPVDLSVCAQKKLQDYHSSVLPQPHGSLPTANSAVFLASDNHYSNYQMLLSLHPNTAVITLNSSVCHLQFTKNTSDCFTSTVLQWFMLSLSDVIVTQEALKKRKDVKYHDNHENQLLAGYPPQSPPVSAFSRFALLYGLNVKSLVYGKCSEVNTTTIGHMNHGDWLCTSQADIY